MSKLFPWLLGPPDSAAQVIASIDGIAALLRQIDECNRKHAAAVGLLSHADDLTAQTVGFVRAAVQRVDDDGLIRALQVLDTAVTRSGADAQVGDLPPADVGLVASTAMARCCAVRDSTAASLARLQDRLTSELSALRATARMRPFDHAVALRSVVVPYWNFGDGTSALCDALRRKSIVTLDLSGCQIGDAAFVESLLPALAPQQALRCAVLSQTGLADRSAASLADRLTDRSFCPLLHAVDLNGNDITRAQIDNVAAKLHDRHAPTKTKSNWLCLTGAGMRSAMLLAGVEWSTHFDVVYCTSWSVVTACAVACGLSRDAVAAFFADVDTRVISSASHRTVSDAVGRHARQLFVGDYYDAGTLRECLVQLFGHRKFAFKATRVHVMLRSASSGELVELRSASDDAAPDIIDVAMASLSTSGMFAARCVQDPRSSELASRKLQDACVTCPNPCLECVAAAIEANAEVHVTCVSAFPPCRLDPPALAGLWHLLRSNHFDADSDFKRATLCSAHISEAAEQSAARVAAASGVVVWSSVHPLKQGDVMPGVDVLRAAAH